MQAVEEVHVNGKFSRFGGFFPMKTALVVDDEPLLRRQVAETLARYGFDEILEASNGQEAIDLATLRKPLLVVMDVGMPVIDGITAAEKIGKVISTPIVLLTGSADPETVERARLAGVISYVVKPFREEQVYAAVDLAIHQFVEVSSLRDEVAKLKETIEARKVIEKAKAALIKKGMSEPEAYRKMQKLAMDKRKSLKEVADAILLME
jgi:AmiR/NasT family two-component response regulator